MGVAFPGLDFFKALQDEAKTNPGGLADLGPCDAYCGFNIGDRLFVLEFEGHECGAVVSGGNPLDLDFVLRGSESAWRGLVESLAKSGGADATGRLADQIEAGALEITTEADDGLDLARAALPFLQGFLELTQRLEVDFA